MSAVRGNERNFEMATIGTFTANSSGEITGFIKTLTLRIEASFHPVEKETDKAPDYRLRKADLEIGAAWKKTSRDGRDYLSVKFDDPSFATPVYATLSETETAGEYALIWLR